MIANTEKFGGVLTCLWHDRSHAPERFWGDFYARLVEKLRTLDVWFGTAGQVVEWFRKRRQVVFDRVESEDGRERVSVHFAGAQGVSPPLTLRMHYPAGADHKCSVKARQPVNIPWNGEHEIQSELLC